VCAHAVRVALKSISGVQTVEVSLEKGEAVATLKAGNSVRYTDLLRAIEKNGFVVKGSTLVADGIVSSVGGALEFVVSGSNDRFRLEATKKQVSPGALNASGSFEVTGSVPEAAKGKSPDVLQYESAVPK
jgi:copper chaperone CopZ